MITFNTPCLKWKLVVAEKLQVGWPGFIAPYLTRYLSKHVEITTSFGGFPPTIRIQDFSMNHFGNVTPSPNPVVAEADFPYAEDPLPTDVFGVTETWTVTESFFQNITMQSGVTIKTEVTLSNPYTIDILNADLDALIGAVDVNSAPWGTLTKNIAPDFGGALSDVNQLIPVQWNYYPYLGGPVVNHPVTIEAPLLAAAYSAYLPGLVSPSEWFANSSVKAVGYVGMAGNYCLKTFVLDDQQNVLDESCQSGIGSCAGSFKVTPPAVNPENNTYIVLTPNCQCGD
jgi:hypothetical protein